MDRIEAIGASIHQQRLAERAAEAQRDAMGDPGPAEAMVRRAVREEREAMLAVVRERFEHFLTLPSPEPGMWSREAWAADQIMQALAAAAIRARGEG
ncbi:MAG: hypothetical protein IPK12_23625 [Gemmatimonadetes bacterium]|nr:hypothetical protein [Gemmatimonadota bacterium]